LSDIENNIVSIKKHVPASVRLVAVSKTMPVDDILRAYNTGQRIFGENRVQEIISKKDHLPQDIEWHLIGHLQTNKVKLVVPFIGMIESVDSFKLLSVIDDEALRINRIVDCLLQIHIAKEETKFGFNLEELEAMFESEEFRKPESIRICGVMGMATFTDDEDQIRNEFK
jgi:PLP dependent protein